MANQAALIRQNEAGKSVVKRDRHSIHFDLGGGQRRAYFSIDPLHYGAALDQEVDTAWIADTGGVWQWKMIASSFNVRAKSLLNVGEILQWTQPETGASITLQPMALNWVNQVTDALQQISMPQSVAASANDQVLYWQNGYGPGRHFKYTVHPRRLVKHLIIDSAANLPTPTVANPYLELSFIISMSSGVVAYVDGVAWDTSTKKNTANNIEFKDAQGNLLWYFNAPHATDANGEGTAGLFQVRKAGNNRYCTIRIPQSWIATAAFPITVDPTFTDGFGGDIFTACDTWVNESSADTNYGTGTYIAVSTWPANRRISLLKFNVSSLAGTTINSAVLSLYNNAQWAADYSFPFYSILAANTGWTEAGATWNHTDGAGHWAGDAASDGGTDAGCSVSATDYAAVSIGTLSYVSGTAAGTKHDVSLAVATVDAWSDGSNYGLLMLGGVASSRGWYSSDEGTIGLRPKLVVDYTLAAGGGGGIFGGDDGGSVIFGTPIFGGVLIR